CFTIKNGAGAAAVTVGTEIDDTESDAGGEIRVDADTIEFRGLAGLATTTFGSKKAGNLIINAENIALLDGAVISADAFNLSENEPETLELVELIFNLQRGLLGNKDIFGQAGNIFITAQTLLLDNRSRLSTTTQSGDGGDITLENLDLLLLRNGDGVGGISTTAGTEQRGGDGGNIKIDADLIIGIAEENSDITANAFSGRGGNIDIETTLILGLEFRDELTRLSDITASSEIGVDGEVVIDDLGIDPVQAAAELSTDTYRPPLSQGCQPGMDGRGRFLNAGRGGIRPNPSDPISSSVGWEDIQPATSQENEQPEETTPPDVIVEAEGWYINEQDQVVLYANIPSIEFNCQSR
ncbi:MAG: S-layer family protein, partial [Symploca sp. SIO1C4]|nr:S-layer family protein [Symploca sp. SIO1C4]